MLPNTIRAMLAAGESVGAIVDRLGVRPHSVYSARSRDLSDARDEGREPPRVAPRPSIRSLILAGTGTSDIMQALGCKRESIYQTRAHMRGAGIAVPRYRHEGWRCSRCGQGGHNKQTCESE